MKPALQLAARSKCARARSQTWLKFHGYSIFIRRILNHADLNMNKRKVLLLAAEDSGLDSNLPGYENVVKNVIHDFFHMNAQENVGTSQEAKTSICSMCLDVVLVHEGHRSITKLVCGHWFHFHCIASAFMAKGAIECPNCRHVKK
ncbi:hypothetical protein MPTK1_7g19580 [Marchantia polymorpha subsp. ruderalis]|uniref:RING-type domain-containing protein n=2 Tax=Marchantia polymorpha TaxID=3197 RepID=A0AAF6C1H4_MARPO|nr:hypothetical protein MARPO_0067s0019 [Marchantia polymorpha]BBN18108.1 hypothetical protein Mp_7g19580 [Marchantia polymorpha subsp. ruderalis]|eukprot:PTQ35925.1 hypothetical protein MARPO_0067s0019 [Marchantia polymorpha]